MCKRCNTQANCTPNRSAACFGAVDKPKSWEPFVSGRGDGLEGWGLGRLGRSGRLGRLGRLGRWLGRLGRFGRLGRLGRFGGVGVGVVGGLRGVVGGCWGFVGGCRGLWAVVGGCGGLWGVWFGGWDWGGRGGCAKT